MPVAHAPRPVTDVTAAAVVARVVDIVKVFSDVTPRRRGRSLAPMPDTALAVARARDLVKIYGEGDTTVRALDGVTVEFPSGHFTAIMGPSGSGKSTLMHCVAGLDSVTSGQVFIGDVELSSLSDKELTVLRRERVGFVFQAFNLIPTLTALENITLPMALAGRDPDKEWLDKVIDTVGLRD